MCIFRSLNVWLKHPGFKELVQQEWSKYSSLDVDQKLKALKKPLKEWNTTKFVNINENLNREEKDLSNLNKEGETRLLDASEL